MQKRTNYFIDLMAKLEELQDLCGMIDVMGGLKDFHVKRLEDKIWVFYNIILLVNRKNCLQRKLNI